MTFTAAVRRVVPPGLIDLGWTARDLLQRRKARAQLRGHDRLHLGCGHDLLDGWANLDQFADPGVVELDLTLPLPVPAGTATFIFSEHFIEHVTRDQASRVLSDCVRVLKPGGVLRISTPNLRAVTAAYLEGRLDAWHDVDWAPASPCQLMNEAMRSWGHQFLYDADELADLLRAVGFHEVCRVRWRQSRHEALRGLERRPDHDDLIFEAATRG